MKLAYVVFARFPTGKAHGLTIAKSCESFARAGAEVTLITAKREIDTDEDIFATYSLERNFRIVEIGVPDLTTRFGGNRVAFMLQYWLFYIAVALRFLFASRRTIIYTRESSVSLFAWMGYRVALESHLISQWRRTYFFLARRADRIIVISNALKQSFLSAGFDEHELLVAASGVDLSTFDIDTSKEDARRELELPQNEFIAVYTGNFTTMGEDKGLNAIIAALKQAPDVRFVAIGGSPKNLEHYRKEAQAAELADRAEFHGYAPQQTLALYEKAADALLMPFPDTPHYRSHMSPVKMFEYMAAERPIIATDLPTIAEVLDETNAYIITPDSPDAIASALKRIRKDSGEALARAKKAKQDVVRYSWSERANRTLAFIQH